MSKYSRREFLQNSALAALTASTTGRALKSLGAENDPRQKGPNDKLGVLVIGVNGRGKSHLQSLSHLQSECDVVAICDADDAVGEMRCDEIEKGQTFRRPKFYKDLRKALEDPAVDCVTIAMPNHWHALAAIWAMQAGKDVYVEKPVCHNISEGRRIIETARKYNRICQAGMQCRSAPANIEAVEYLHSGKIGDVQLARALCYKPRGSIGAKGIYQPPNTVDYDLWCGPAPREELTRPKLHYDWHWFWSTGNGDLGNQGVHQMDVARWGLGVNSLADGVMTYGGRFGYEDAGQTPNTEVTVLDFGTKTLVFEVRGLATDAYKGVKIGNLFEGTNGSVVMTTYNSGAAFDKDGNTIKTFSGDGDHFENFFKAVRSRSKADLNADIEDGFLSSALCHMGNISYQLGQRMPKPEAIERLKSVRMAGEAQDTLNRTIDHLTHNKVTLEGENSLRCGQYLKFDPAQESFVESEAANQMLTREYRVPFVVPSKAGI